MNILHLRNRVTDRQIRIGLLWRTGSSVDAGPFLRVKAFDWMAIFFCFLILFCGCSNDFARIKRNSLVSDRFPSIKPDYTGITIPPNMTPLNFSVQDSCSGHFAEIFSANGAPITVRGKKGKILIDPERWKKLLSENAGNPLRVNIYAGSKRSGWRRYKTIENSIASEPIDRYITYRLLSYQYNFWRDLRLCQRDLSCFTETALINTKNYSFSYLPGKTDQSNALRCVNCHTPMNNDPDRFVLQLRSNAHGAETLIADGDSITTLKSRLGHVAWHPTGNYIAFSSYLVQQYFHSTGPHFIDVCDNNSHIVIYDVTGRKLISVPQLNVRGRNETWPAWSADGRHLYFCAAKVPWSDYSGKPPENYNRIKYSLLRIAYDPVNKIWGETDTVLSTEKTGLSVSLPRISPDNRFCVFAMHDNGAYAFSDTSSDLYIMDLKTGEYRKLPVNSEYMESWHSWSSNGRWILFLSRRGSGLFTRLFISHVDSAGKAGKPFILPQRDPEFYDNFIKCYNVAEFAKGPLKYSQRQLLKAINAPGRVIPLAVPSKPGMPSDMQPNNWVTFGGGRE